MYIKFYKSNLFNLPNEIQILPKKSEIKLALPTLKDIDPAQQSLAKERFKLFKTFKRGGEIILFCVPALILQITALFISLFGVKGKSSSEKILYSAQKMCSIYIIHNLFRPFQFFFSPAVLCRLKNIANKNVIQNEEDKQKYQEFIDLLKNPEYVTKKRLNELTPKQISFLQNFSAKGAIGTGICWGASLYLIKLLLSNKIKSEKDLIDLLRPYKKGFPAEASALQSVSEAFISYKQKRPQYRAVDNLNDIKIDNASEKKIKEMTENLEDLIKNIKEERQENNNSEMYVASLTGLNFRTYNSPLLYGEVNKKEIQIKFNQINAGYYLLNFNSKKQGHAILYIKKDFGSYFVDSNLGLIRCKTSDPGMELSKLIKKTYSHFGKFRNCELRVYKIDQSEA